MVFIAGHRYPLEQKVFDKEQKWAISKRKKSSAKTKSKRIKPAAVEEKPQEIK